MHPILLNFGSFVIYSYGFFVALAFVTAILYLSWSIKKLKQKIISQNELFSLFVYLLIISIIGARSFFVLINLDKFISYPIEIFEVWHGGLVYYGGLIAVMFFMSLYVKRKKMSLLKLGDLFSPALALGHTIGRVGCFFAGCCYGRESTLPWAVAFTNGHHPITNARVCLHPTQLYEAFGNFLLFLFLHFYSKKKHRNGLLLVIYFMGYGVLRFVIEFFRGDHGRMQYFGFSTSQIISAMLFVIGVFIITCKKE
jgi:phosphatidylglycerol:prolipoprotein diacylglycerol transferase